MLTSCGARSSENTVPWRHSGLQRSREEPWGDTYTTFPDRKDTAMEKVSWGGTNGDGTAVSGPASRCSGGSRETLWTYGVFQGVLRGDVVQLLDGEG